MGTLNDCQQIQTRIDDKTKTLNNWQSELDLFLANTNMKNVKEIRGVMDIVEHLEEDILELKAEQRRLGCLVQSLALSPDNQTIISTSSVRRKDAKALEIIDHKVGKL